ncbi:MAG: hypothetical protein AAFR01_08875 [Pseudomonadota bacterium]
MNFTTPALCLTLAITIAACTTTTRPLTLNDNRIVRGERIGEVQIGMPLATLTALKGTPQKTRPMQTGATTYIYDGFSVAAHDEVYWVIAYDPKFRTANGIAPGMQQIDARAAAGTPNCVLTGDTETTYDYSDLYFTVDNQTGRVLKVGVRRAQDWCSS